MRVPKQERCCDGSTAGLHGPAFLRNSGLAVRGDSQAEPYLGTQGTLHVRTSRRNTLLFRVGQRCLLATDRPKLQSLFLDSTRLPVTAAPEPRHPARGGGSDADLLGERI